MFPHTCHHRANSQTGYDARRPIYSVFDTCPFPLHVPFFQTTSGDPHQFLIGQVLNVVGLFGVVGLCACDQSESFECLLAMRKIESSGKMFPVIACFISCLSATLCFETRFGRPFSVIVMKASDSLISSWSKSRGFLGRPFEFPEVPFWNRVCFGGLP